MRVLRWIVRGFVVVLGLAVVAIGGVYAQSQRLITSTGRVTRRTITAAPTDSAAISRGATLAAVTGCLGCHASNLGGAVMLDQPMLGRLVGPNLTTGRGGVLRHYDDRALDAAIRDGMGWDGRKLAVMPANEFAHLADDDVAAIIAYLRTQPPVDLELSPVAYGPAFRAAIALGKFPFAYDSIDHARVTPPSAPRGATAEHGRYLVGSCTGCHGATLAGGPVHGSDRIAPNLTPRARIAQWSQAEFTRVMREGIRPDGSIVDAVMPWRVFAKLTDDEVAGLYLYLRTVPPVATVTK
jgi:mono/diheme cytochrome c family protein